jgi:D-galactarolactone cycloisomerase
MKIREVRARWLHCPIPEAQQHVSDFGRIESFDMALVSVEVESGLVGYGEAKAAVGSSGACQSVVAAIEGDLGSQLVGQDARRVTGLWDEMYNGTRSGFAISRGRAFPILGRRGLAVSAMSGVDMALWDLLGRSHDAPVLDLWGGPRCSTMPAYASGGWADTDGIGQQLQGHGPGSTPLRADGYSFLSQIRKALHGRVGAVKQPQRFKIKAS